MKFSTQTSRAHNPIKTFAAMLLAAAVAAGGSPAHAQVSLFKDEEARQKLAELEEKVELIQANLRTLASEAANLQSEKQELLTLIRQMSGLVEEANLISSKHDSRITEIDGKIEASGEELDRTIKENFGKVAAALVSDDMALYDRGILSYHTFDYDKAEGHFRELLLRYPASAYAHASTYWLGRLLYDKGNIVESQETLQGLLVSHPNSPRVPDALHLLSQIASDQGDKEYAAILRRKLLEQHPSSAAADSLRSEGNAGT